MMITQADPSHRARRVLVVLSIVLFVVAAALLYVGFGYVQHRQPSHTYSINQSVASEVRYFDTSFFGNDHVVASDKAYIADLTKTITPRFRITYESESSAQVSYAYEVVATLYGSSTVRDESDGVEVWSQQYTFVPLSSRTEQSTQAIRIDEAIELNFTDYNSLVSQFRDDIAVPIDGRLEVVMRASFNGEADGVSFNNESTATFTVPLGQQVFKTKTTTEEPIVEHIYSDSQQESLPLQPLRIAGFVAAVVAVALGIVALLLGSERRVFKTPYQRKLAKIYRYYDSSIVKASQPVDTTGKQVVQVSNFTDMLDIEEDLKVPIIASELGDEASRFTIIHEDMAYVYTLGVVHQKYKPPKTKR